MENFTIVGFGCAGFDALKAISESGKKADIKIFSDSRAPLSNPMLTTYYAAGKINLKSAFPFGDARDIAKKFGAKLYEGHKVKAVLTKSKALICEDDSRFEFDKLLISTGAQAFIPPLEELSERNVCCMRTMRDAEYIKETLRTNKIKRAVVVGASMAGVKVAELLAENGTETVIADMAPHIFPLSAYPHVADMIQSKLDAKNIKFLFKNGITAVHDKGDRLDVRFGEHNIEADLAVLCIGTRALLPEFYELIPKTDRALLVDEYMKTDISGIFAAGDCCAGRDIRTGQNQVIGLWSNARAQGRTAGLNMSGQSRRYPGNILHNITHFFGMDFISIGDNRVKGTFIESELKDGYICATLKDGEIACVNIFGSYKLSGLLKNYIIKRFSSQEFHMPGTVRGKLLHYGLSGELLDVLEAALI